MERKNNFTKIFSREKIKTGGLLTCKTLATSTSLLFLQMPPLILCPTDLTVSASKTPSNEPRINTHNITPS